MKKLEAIMVAEVDEVFRWGAVSLNSKIRLSNP